MGSSHSIKEISEEDLKLMKRQLLYEFSVFTQTYNLSQNTQNDFHECLCSIQEGNQELYHQVLNDDDIGFKLCAYLMENVDLREQNTHLGATELKDFLHVIPDFGTFLLNDGEAGATEEPEHVENRKAQLWDVNETYYVKLKDKKLGEVKQANIITRMEEPDGGWTLDTWNEAKASLHFKSLSVGDDPELQIWSILGKKIFGDERFHCGSIGENVVTTFLGNPQFSDTDVDVMYCSPLPGTLIDTETRTGYTRILLTDKSKQFPSDEDNFVQSSHWKLQNLQDSLTSQKKNFPDVEMSRAISGPAVGLYGDSNMTVKDMDHVYGFCGQDGKWPAIAEEWRVRDRFISGWPTKKIINKAISHGTYVVPVAHRHSDNPDIEWRYSFSKPEIDLMHSITKKQRKCFMLTKHLCKLIFSGFKIFCSYYVKASFFWMLEEMPAFYWELMTMDNLVDYLLDKIIYFFACQNLPNYFIRHANVIDHIPRDHQRTVLQKLQRLRQRDEKDLPQYMLKDICLFYINITVEPQDESCILFVPQHHVAFALYAEASEQKLPKSIAEMLQKYSQMDQGSTCGPNSDSNSVSDLESFPSRKIQAILDDLKALNVDDRLRIMALFEQEAVFE